MGKTVSGATAVQVYTVAHVKGVNAPQVITELNDRLIRYMDNKGINQIAEVQGRALPLLDQKTNLEPLVPEVLTVNCTGCDLCIPVCLPQSISPIQFNNRNAHIVEIDADSCVGCGHCVTVCPTNALEI